MLCLTAVLSDDTTVCLRETPDAEAPYGLEINGKTECCYFDFDFAWSDFGRCVCCATWEDAKGIAYS